MPSHFFRLEISLFILLTRFWLSFDHKQFLDIRHGLITVNLDSKPLAIMIDFRPHILLAEARTQLMQNGLDLFSLYCTEYDLDQ